MKTSIDWLTFRTKSFDPFKIVHELRPIFGTVADLVSFQGGGKPRDGWKVSGEIMLSDIRLGHISYGGGQNEWIQVNLTGEGCAWVQHWDLVEQIAYTFDQAEIRRLDIALTTYKGEVNDQMILDAHSAGRFISGGRPPSMESHVSTNPRAGKTRYIGERKGSDKFLRCYEKGWEMVAKMPPSERENITHIGDDLIVDMYRVEVEFKAVNRDIPWFAINDRDAVFAGAYPYLAELLPMAGEFKLSRLPDFKPKAALASMLDNCRNSYGGAIAVALKLHGNDYEKVCKMICGDTFNQNLVDAGVLTL